MSRWILSAEADKIQDFVFCSSHLREVVGGSQLLTRFCGEAMPMLLARQRYGDMDPQTVKQIEQDVVVADGGSFTILFDEDDKSDPKEFGRKLAQLYREVTGSTLTVTDPVKWSGYDEDFPQANKEARQQLALAKRQGREAIAAEHLPYAAFCASCGVGLAYTHGPLHEAGDANYSCRACRYKAEERKNEGGEFLLEFKKTVAGASSRDYRWVSEAESVANEWEPRNYVAYLVADGNGMGKVFGKCKSPDQLRALSKSLTRVLRESLAEPTKLLMDRAPESKKEQIPVLPLILGGDDVFVLLPAPYALDFARCFCLEYERRMGKVLKELKLGEIKPTMSTAVVICKAKYPYTLAHRHGEELLKQAKQLTKTVAFESLGSLPHSIVDFDVILGSRIAGIDGRMRGKYRATLRPYWVSSISPGEELPSFETQLDSDAGTPYPLTPFAPVPANTGLPIDRLIHWRRELIGLPNRRLAQLRALFAPQRMPTDETLGHWQARLQQVTGRIAGRSQIRAECLDDLLAELGGQTAGFWYNVGRPGPEGNVFLGHGLPDLIEMWDFCYKLTANLDDYRTQEVER